MVITSKRLLSPLTVIPTWNCKFSSLNYIPKSIFSSFIYFTFFRAGYAVQLLLRLDRPDLAQQRYALMKSADEDGSLTQLAGAALNLRLVSHVISDWLSCVFWKVTLSSICQGGTQKIQDAANTYQDLGEKYGTSVMLLVCSSFRFYIQGSSITLTVLFVVNRRAWPLLKWPKAILRRLNLISRKLWVKIPPMPMRWLIWSLCHTICQNLQRSLPDFSGERNRKYMSDLRFCL